jgi:membrane protein YqaA with SNARE-associated domain
MASSFALHDSFAAQLNTAEAPQALAMASAAETIFLPVRTDVLLADRVLLAPESAFTSTLATTAGSVVAGGALYVLGAALALAGGGQLLSASGLGGLFVAIQIGLHAYAALLVVTAGVATAPFAALMIASGFLGAAPLWLFPAAVAARSLRYGLMSWLLWRGGLRYRDWLGRYYHGLTMVVALGLLLAVVFVILLKYSV